MKLDIGGGDKALAGYVNVDPYFPEADVRATMWQLPFADDSAEVIHCSHALEHIPQKMVVPTLREWRRVIKPGGVIIIRVPDLLWICEEFLKDPVRGWRLATIFGAQTHEGEFHKTGFTKEWMLKDYLPAAELQLLAFEEVWSHEQRTLSFEVSK